MATSQTCCHLPGELLNSAAECADRARICSGRNSAVKVRPIGPKRDLNEMKKDVEVRETRGIELMILSPPITYPVQFVDILGVARGNVVKGCSHANV